MQNDTCYILALIKRDDGERLLLGSGFYEFTKEQKHFNPNLFANDVVELQGADGQLLAGQVRRSTAQSFDGYIGDGTTSKQIVEQKRREFFLFFRKQHHYTVVYIMPDGTAIKRDRGYIVDAPAVQELYQVQPKWHVSLAFEDVNYYSYAEDSQGHEIYAFSADLNLASVLGGGLKWDANGAISSPTGLGNIRISGDTFQQTYTGINLLDNSGYDTGSSNSVSYTRNADGTYTLSGTASAFTYFRMGYVQFDAETQVYLTGAPEGASMGTFSINLMKNGATYGWQTDAFAEGRAYTLEANTPYYFAIVVRRNADVSGLVFKPQIELGSSGSDYQPFVGGAPSPNPDFPQPVQTVTGEQTVTIGGADYPLTLKSKNLFDKNSLTVGSLQGDGSTTGTNVVYQTSDFIEVEPSTTYYKTVSNSARLKFYGAQREPLSNVYDDIPNAGDAQAFTTPADAHYMRLTVTSGFFDVLQIELGSTPTAYVPFLDIELCKLGDYQDYIWKDGDDWKVHKETTKKTLVGEGNTFGKSGNSSNNSFYYASAANVGHYVFSDIDTAPLGGSSTSTIVPKAACNAFKVKSPSAIVTTNTQGATFDYIVNTSITELRLGFGLSSTINTTALLRSWLDANRPIFYYGLATPTDTTITNTTLITQLNAIEEAMGADGRPTAIVPTGDNLAAIITGEPNGTGGYEWEASEGGGPSFITVEGVDDALPVWHVVGPATNPTLTNSSNGLSITWNGTVPAGQELIVDMGAQTATMEGANVFQYISGSWLTLSPGTNRIAYTAANTTAGSKIYWNEIVG